MNFFLESAVLKSKNISRMLREKMVFSHKKLNDYFLLTVWLKYFFFFFFSKQQNKNP